MPKFWDRLRGKKSDPEPKKALDSAWVSPFGHGKTVDRSMRASFAIETLDPQTLQYLYDHNGIVKRAIGMPVHDALRQGYTLTFDGDVDPQRAQEIRNAVQEWDEENGLTQQISRHLVQRRLFGGSVLLQIESVDQSQPYFDASPPKSEDGPRFLALSPHEIWGQNIETDPMRPGYRLPTKWTLNQSMSTFMGIDVSWTYVSTSEQVVTTSHLTGLSSNYEWTGPSVLSSFYQESRAWGISQQAATSALQEINRTVYKIEGAGTVLGSPAADTFKSRYREIEEAASMFQPAILDTTESMDRSPLSVSGIGDILDRQMVALSAACGIPIIVLFGTSPGGFGTGEGEMRMYHDKVRFEQRHDVRPILRWAISRLFASGAVDAPPGGWNIEFPPIVGPTEQEDAALRYQTAQTDVLYIQNGVLSSEEVAQSRFGGSEWTMETTLDQEMRELEAQELLDDPQLNREPNIEEEPEEEDGPGTADQDRDE